ncbi:MAG: MFS transporter [Tannerellaceae bacterium]|jgi:PAT family beta-lactamase induction signal transducer AmpG|nr:MFS transporter [Tannerellaceae bacterium]
MKTRSPWAWIPTLYFTEALPYVAVMSVTVIMYKRLGVSNSDIAFYTAWLNFPWVIKPLWSPFVDLLKTKRWWIVSMQLLIGAGLAGVALTIPAPFFLRATLAIFWLLAFGSATHDIAADGFYMLELSADRQAFFIGIRNLCYRLALLTGQGALVILAGLLEESTGRIAFSWSLVFMIMAGLLIGLGLWHRFILPHPKDDAPRSKMSAIMPEFLKTFEAFFRKKGIVAALLFLLTFRLGESQLVKMASPFLLDDRSLGGLGLNTSQVGLAYGTLGMVALVLGGILGGVVLSAFGGLRRWLWPMTLALFLPNIAYLYMAMVQPGSLWVIYSCVVVEQFGYGFGFTAYTMYMMMFSAGSNKTSHYAVCTGFMALGMMLPGMISGRIQELAGYPNFFLVVVICGLPVFLVLPFLQKYLNKQ